MSKVPKSVSLRFSLLSTAGAQNPSVGGAVVLDYRFDQQCISGRKLNVLRGHSRGTGDILLIGGDPLPLDTISQKHTISTAVLFCVSKYCAVLCGGLVPIGTANKNLDTIGQVTYETACASRKSNIFFAWCA